MNPFVFTFLQQTRATAEHPPLFPLLLSVTSWLGGRTVLAHQLTTALLGTAGIPVLAALGRRVGGTKVGIAAALIVAVLPNFWRYEVLVLAESALLLVFGLFLLGVYRWWDRPTLSRCRARRSGDRRRGADPLRTAPARRGDRRTTRAAHPEP